ncbi:unnamed protein product [Symbiodinium sp. KB8]|nr:unnamed protein product [Symbiodinium sp. KB8]
MWNRAQRDKWGQGELGLNIGDVVRLLMDPQVGTGQDRWVYCSKEDGSDRGWLPLSHLVPQSAEKTEPKDGLEAETPLSLN